MIIASFFNNINGVYYLKLELYDKKEPLEHINNLAFNRTATTVGELYAKEYIKSELEKEEFNVIIHHFYWSGFARLLRRVLHLLIISILIISGMILLIPFYYIITKIIKRNTSNILFSNQRSNNIYTIIPAINRKPDRSLIIFSAHYDSIVYRIPYRFLRVFSYIFKYFLLPQYLIISFLSIVVIFAEFLGLKLDPLLTLILFVMTLIGTIITLFYMFLISSNSKESTGSIDNASGTSILIVLAKLLKKNPLKNTDVLFIWTGAEEWGLLGSKNFCETYIKFLGNNYDLNKSINVNVDMVGSYIGLMDKKGFIKRNKPNSSLNNIIKKIAEDLNIPISSFNKILDVKSDHKIFRKKIKNYGYKKFQATCFHSHKDMKYIHSISDSPDKCSYENLNGCINICYSLSKYIDKNNI